MKQLVIFCMILFIGFTEAFAQIIDEPVGPPMPPTNQYVKEINVDVSIKWDNNGIGHATITLPFSLNDKSPTNALFSPVFDYTYKDKIIEFTFNSPTPKTEMVTLKFEDAEYRFGYMNTPKGHAYFAYKWKYIININFDYNL